MLTRREFLVVSAATTACMAYDASAQQAASSAARRRSHSGLFGDRGRRLVGFCPAAFAFAKETNNRSV